MIQRKFSPKRRTPIKSRKKGIARNVAPKKKNVKALKTKLARYQAFMRSPEWAVIRQAAFERAGYQCQAKKHAPDCLRTSQLTVHHKRYGIRFGGNELPSDLEVLSKPCHKAVEAMKPGLPLWMRAKGRC